ncbi:MAG: metal ABC transporter permease, partial [Desulfitobacteriaceae bacterium]|nr:metal ABC transporter permease [Desulfitobacteriaceae bacterium]
GLFLSYYLDLKPGGTIVITGVITLAIVFFMKRRR